jgi:response regulator RpfG family c-di-GMP phosphodiesterase
MRRHTVVGEAMISGAPTLRAAAALVRASHERWDGLGYPDGLAARRSRSAPVSSRSATPSARCGRTVPELRRCAGTQFDPRVVHAFCHAHGASAVAV